MRDLPEGFYIDVGAEDPTADSVTRAFYERGWRGINVEPVQGHFDKLCDQRPRDLTLQVAIGDRTGWATLYEFPDTGLSTLLKKVASRHQSGGLSYVERRIPIVTLTSLWEDFVEGEVHFLKIDVEGYEPQVLSGISLTRFRPWIILVEATAPRTSEETWYEWEDQILESQYEFVHFDGLNRWYLAAEDRSLRTALMRLQMSLTVSNWPEQRNTSLHQRNTSLRQRNISLSRFVRVHPGDGLLHSEFCGTVSTDGWNGCRL